MFTNFIGQSDVISYLKTHITYAKTNNKILPHILLDGGPGLGKTSITKEIANILNVDLMYYNASTIKSHDEIFTQMITLKAGDILFIDEIHALSKDIMESLYSAMTDFMIEIKVGSTRQQIKLPPFTVIGATTDSGCLTRPLYDRFIIKQTLQLYSNEDLHKIIQSQNTNITPRAARLIASCGKGTPRIVLNLIKELRVFTNKDTTLKYKTVKNILNNTLHINEIGLNQDDLNVLKTLYNNNFTLSLSNLCTISQIPQSKYVVYVEPYLLKTGYISCTPRGRSLTPKAIQYLNVSTTQNNTLYERR